MEGVRKGREGNLGARLNAWEKGGEERFLLPAFSCAIRASHAPKILLPFPLERLARMLDYLSYNGKKWNVFTRNIEILVSASHYTLIASLFCFLHVSVVSFNVSCIKAFNKRQCLIVCTNLVH